MQKIKKAVTLEIVERERERESYSLKEKKKKKIKNIKAKLATYRNIGC